MNRRVRDGLAVAGVVIALAAGTLLLATHHVPSGFETAVRLATRPLRRGVQYAVRMPQGTVDVNRATAEELCALKGIGPKLSQAIVEERQANGPFRLPEDLVAVKGIGEKKLAGFFDQLDWKPSATTAP